MDIEGVRHLFSSLCFGIGHGINNSSEQVEGVVVFCWCFFFSSGCCESSERNVKFAFHVDVLEDQLAEVVSQTLGLLWSIAVEIAVSAFLS